MNRPEKHSSAGRRLGVAVLGATGSVGRQALEVIAAFPERFQVIGLTANENVETMEGLVDAFRPRLAAMVDERAAGELDERLGGKSEARIESGSGCLLDLACAEQVDLVVAAIVGRAGLPPVYSAVRAGKTVALANKESLVMAGGLVMSEAKRSGASIVPIDSEHAGAHQLLSCVPDDQVRRLILTASGGPFFGRSRRELAKVTAREALAHPNWEMGAKISIDSATMMNKGFEIMEARWLFELQPERIDVLIHPQSLVHALVEMVDGSILSQMAAPDMRGPIAYALGFPERLDLARRLSGFHPPDLARAGELGFYPADEREYPAIRMCRDALGREGGMPAALSVADEVLVEAFLQGRIGFNDITDMLQEVLERMRPISIRHLQDVLDAGEQGAELARGIVADRAG
jgi:1-deoxy-D-xylulose-5-phosphate reductoisomerase